MNPRLKRFPARGKPREGPQMRRTGRFVHTIVKAPVALAASLALLAPSAGQAQGDLLIAPTRLVLDARRGGEVIQSNQSNEPATYRITLELRRMDSNGDLVPVDETQANATEKAALAMVRYAPHRVLLPPQQPQ